MQDVQETDTLAAPALARSRRRRTLSPGIKPTGRLQNIEPQPLEQSQKRLAWRAELEKQIASLQVWTSQFSGSLRSRLGTVTADIIIHSTSLTSRGMQQIVSVWQRTDFRAVPQRIQAARQHFLLYCHLRLSDRSLNRLLFVPSPEQSDLAKLLAGAEQHSATTDRPIPQRVFNWALKAIHGETKSCTFVDCKAGRGRALVLASRHPFEAIVGVEPSATLHDDALMNISQFPRSLMACRTIECLHSDPADLPIADESAVYFLFAPPGRAAMEQLIGRIVASYRQQPRRLYIVAVDPRHIDIIENSEVFEPIAYPLATRIKASLFSPFRIAAYRTLV